MEDLRTSDEIAVQDMCNELEAVKKSFEDTIWMAIRYAHGRSTYAPSMVRDAVNRFKQIFPDWKLKKDTTIKPPEKIDGIGIRSDYLDDLFEK